MVEIELLTVSDCPNRATALGRMREALDRVGAAQVVVAERVIDDVAVAHAVGMHGSPTVLIDGHDPFTPAGTVTSVSCRLYRTATGFDGAPSVEDLVVVVGVHGLVARTTRHRIEHAGGVAHTWCALDAIGIPSALRIDADAVTSCPTCGAELRVVLLDGQPVDRGQPLRLWLPEGPCDHLVEDFCNHANLYCSPDHLTATMPDDSPGRAVTISEAATIGRQTWHDAATTLASREDESR